MAGMDTEFQMKAPVSYDEFYSELDALQSDLHKEGTYGFSPLHVAVLSEVDSSRIVHLITERGADVNAATPDGHTPLHFAVVLRKLSIVKALLEAGASVNAKNSAGRTALHLSINRKLTGFLIPQSRSEMSVAEILVSHPEIELNPVDEDGETPLMWAVKERERRTIKALLKKGANIDTPDRHRRTPLHVALSAENSFDDVAILLLRNGAGLYHRDNTGQTPIDYLVNNVCDQSALVFSISCARLIALRYHVTENLKLKLDQIPNMLDNFRECCKQAGLMRKWFVYGKVTLHDFALDCFQSSTSRVKDPVLEIFVPVVEILLTDVFYRYTDFIFCRLSKADWHSVLETIVGESLALDLVPKDASNFTIFEAVRRAYDDNVELRGRLLELKKFLEKKL